MERPLGPMERVLYEIDRIYPLNFTSVARIRGPLTEAATRAALDAATVRHPHLRHRIVADESGWPWLRDGAPPLSLRWARGAEWIPEADQEVNEPLPMATGPLVRCVVIEHAAEEHTVLLTFHHCIGDGFSGAYLMRDLVQAASGSPLAPLPEAGDLDALVPAQARGWRSVWPQVLFGLRELWRALRYGAARAVRDRPEVLAFQRRARVASHLLAGAELIRLSDRARAEGTTVHGALSAALILAMVHDIGKGQPISVGFGSPINVRKQLSPAVGEDLGLYVSMASWGGRVAPDRDLWDLARDVRQTLVTDQARGFALAAHHALRRAASWLGAGRVSPQVLAARLERLVRSTGGLTNLGKLDLATRFGELEIEQLHFLTSPSAMGAWVSAACSINGNLVWNFTWAEPAITEARARALADDSVRRLRSALETPSGRIAPSAERALPPATPPPAGTASGTRAAG